MRSINVLPMILAGGIGERLYPLTSNRAKPAVPFGGNFRIIDFTLMNCVCSGLRNIHVLTQYHTQSLSQHRAARWNFLACQLGEFIDIVPPKMRAASGVYRGTADAIYRNLDLLDRNRPDVVLVLSGDHVYRADYQKLIEAHLELEADVTVLTDYVEPKEASSFGVVNIEPDGRIIRFVEKPADPTPYLVDGRCLINLGVYCFQTEFLVERLVADAKRQTAHDFGRNLLPESVTLGAVRSCPLEVISPDPRPYWRDVGTIDSYFQASMDLLRAPAAFELADPRWPRNSPFREWLPAVYANTARIEGATVQGRNLVAAGAEVESPNVVSSILSPRARVGRGCEIEESVLFPDVEIGEGTRLRRVIVEEGVRVPPGLRIGFGTGDSTDFAVSSGGVTVINQRTFESSRAPRAETLAQIAETLSRPAVGGQRLRDLEAITP